MGHELRCTAQWDGKRSEGKALLESTELLFRGEFRLKIALSEVEGVDVEGSELVVRWKEQTARFDLGPAVAKWADRIRNPKSRMDKLGVPSGSHVVVLGIDDPQLVSELRSRAGQLSEGAPRMIAQVIFLGVSQTSELARLRLVRWYLHPEGALWIVRPKGNPGVREADVRSMVKELGFVDTKVVSLSETLTADKYVRRKR